MTLAATCVSAADRIVRGFVRDDYCHRYLSALMSASIRQISDYITVAASSINRRGSIAEMMIPAAVAVIPPDCELS